MTGIVSNNFMLYKDGKLVDTVYRLCPICYDYRRDLLNNFSTAANNEFRRFGPIDLLYQTVKVPMVRITNESHCVCVFVLLYVSYNIRYPEDI